METPLLEFVHRGQPVRLRNIPATLTLLQLLRDELGLTATKEGCNEGDCGACTVVVAEKHGDSLRYQAVNSCIRLAHSLHGRALWTAADLAAADGSPHPVQQALLQAHASQCGFCTPGFAMSLFALYQSHVLQGATVTRELAQQSLSGNLCRCTGYRPILDAAQQLAKLPLVLVDESLVLQQLALLAQPDQNPVSDLTYKTPLTLAALLAERAAHPQAQVVAGCTDVGLWLNKLHQQVDKVLDLSRVTELRQISADAHDLTLGAAVTLTDAFAALLQERTQLQSFASRFAGLPVRNAGTLGGNVANGSPIGDSMPLLIALRARVVLASLRGRRELPLEALYTGYRQNVLAGDEVLACIKVPRPRPNELLRVYKISKRFEDDISAVCLALCLHLDAGLVTQASIGVGGVAATPVRAVTTEAALTGQAWSQETAAIASTALRAEFAPISDMRASSSYRTQVLGNLMQRFWLESQGQLDTCLDNLSFEVNTP